MKKMVLKQIFRLSVGLMAIGIMLSPMTSSAIPFRLGEVGGLLDVTLAYGLQWRTEDPSPKIVSTANGGDSTNANLDEGDLNYKKGGLTSNIVRGTAELSLIWRNFGLYARGYGFYDFKNEDDCCAHMDLTDQALDLVGSDVDLLDHYIDFKFEPAGKLVHLRLGSQVLNWGQNAFLSGGVNIINPVNLPLASQPTSTPKDSRIPVGMLWGAATLSEVFNVEAFYQYEWKKTILPPLGSFFSPNDAITPGTTSALLAGAIPDSGVDLGPLGFYPNFGRIPRVDSEDPSDQGQWGITVRGFIPQWSDAEVAVHFVNYHSKMPVVNIYTPDAAAYAANTAAGIAARALAIQEQTGVPPGQAAALSLLTGINQYTQSSRYSAEYLENIKMLGLSFSRTTIGTGTSVTAEIAHHMDAPMIIGFDPWLWSYVSGIGVLGIGDTQLGPPPGPNQKVKGFITRDQTLTTAGFNQFFGPRLGASQTFLAGELGWLHVWDMPSKNDLRIFTSGMSTKDVIGRGGKESSYADADSWGYRLAAGMTYSNVLRAVNLRPRVIWSQDVNGNSPAPTGQFFEGKKAISVGLGVDYLNRKIQGQISYTSFFGGGRHNVYQDRDFVNFSLSYSF